MIPIIDSFKEVERCASPLVQGIEAKPDKSTPKAGVLMDKKKMSLFKNMRSSMSRDDVSPSNYNGEIKQITFKDDFDPSKAEPKLTKPSLSRPSHVRPSLSKLALMKDSIDFQMSPALKNSNSGSQLNSPASALFKKQSIMATKFNEKTFQRLNSIFNPSSLRRIPSIVNMEDIEKEEIRMQVMKKIIDNKKVEFFTLVKSSIEEDLAIESVSPDRENEQNIPHAEEGQNIIKDEDAQEYQKLYEMERAENEELLFIEHKNSLELLKMYVDTYPLLRFRKKFLKIFKHISVICHKIIKHQWFEYCTLIVIIMNSILLALEDPNVDTTDPIRQNFEDAFLILYTIEMFLKISALGFLFNPGAYLRDAWNVLDFVIVFTAYLPLLLSNDSGVNLSSLRSLRVLRPLRTISSIKNLKVLLRTLFSALPLLMDTVMILMFFFIVFAIAGVQLFSGMLKKRCVSEEFGKPHPSNSICGGVDCPSGYFCAKLFDNPNYGIINFDNMLFSFLMIFQCVTMEGWSEIMILLIKAFNFLSVIYFVLVVFIGSFFLLNLTLAVIKVKFTESLGKEEDKSAKSIGDGFDIHMFKLVKRYQRSHKRDIEIKGFKKLQRVGAQTNPDIADGRLNFALFEEELKHEKELKRKASQRRPRKPTIRNSKRGSIRVDNFQYFKNHLASENALKNIKKPGFFKVPSAFNFASNIKFLDVKLVPKKTMPVLPSQEHTSSQQNGHKKASIMVLSETIRNKPQGALMMRRSTINVDFLPSIKDENLTEGFLDEDEEFLHSLEHPKETKDVHSKAQDEGYMMMSATMLFSKKKTKSIGKSFLKEDSFEVSDDEVLKTEEEEIKIHPLQPAKIIETHSRKIQGPKGKTFLVEKTLLDDSDFISNQEKVLPPIEVPKIINAPVDPFEESYRDSYRPLLPFFKTPASSKAHSPRIYPETYISTDSVKEDVMTDIPPDYLNSHRDTFTSVHKVKHEFHEDQEAPFTKKGYAHLNGHNGQVCLKSNRVLIARVTRKNHRLSSVFKKPKPIEKSIKPKATLAQNFRSLTSWFLGFKNCFQNSEDNLYLPKASEKKDSMEEALANEMFIYKRGLTSTGAALMAQLTYDISKFKMSPKKNAQSVLNSIDDVLSQSLKRRVELEQEKLHAHIKQLKLELVYIELGKKKPKSRRHKKVTKKLEKNDSQKELERKNTMSKSYQSAKSLNGRSTNNFSRQGTNFYQTTSFGETMEINIKKTFLAVASPNFQRLQVLKAEFDYDDKKGGFSVRSKSLNENEEIESPMPKKRRKINKKPKSEASKFDYNGVSLLINEKLDHDRDRFTDYKSLYFKIKEFDLKENKISKLHWSGSQTLENSSIWWKIKHIQNYFKALTTKHQDKIIWLPGSRGMVKIIRKYLLRFSEGPFWVNLILLCVVGNTIILSLDGLFDDDPNALDIFQQLNISFTILFACEMIIKILAIGPLSYIRDRMNIFDGLIVVLSLVELIFLSGGNSAISAFRSVRIFRTFRVLRVTRLLRSLEFMKIILAVISRSITTFMYIALLLILFIFIYSLLGMQFFGGKMNFTENKTRSNFDSFLSSTVTVFQILTLENWQEILSSCFRSEAGPILSILYLISWIFIGNYIFLNLFLAILLDGFTSESGEVEEEEEKENDMENYKVIEEEEKKIEEENETNKKKKKILILDEDDDLIEIDLLQRKKTITSDQNMFFGIREESSLFFFSKSSCIRVYCFYITKHKNFDNFILLMIVLSSFKLVFDSYLDMNTVDPVQLQIIEVSAKLDIFFTLFFALESLMKSISMGFWMRPGSYLRETWNVLDFFIVVTALIDLSFDSIDIPFIKILRLLRTLRPLRFITHSVNMRIVVNALLSSVGAMVNVLIVVGLIWLMFAILGMSLLSKRMGYCDGVESVYGVNKETCLSKGNSWKKYSTSFDNIMEAMVTLFVLSSLEGWPDIMFAAVDSNLEDVGPVIDSFRLIILYYIFFIVIGSFFLLNLFVGVIFFHFNLAQKQEKTRGSIFLSDEQLRWIDIQKLIIKAKPDFASNRIPTRGPRGKIYKLISHSYFETFIMICIVFNVIQMAVSYDGATVEYDSTLENINLGFTSVFIMECLLKIIALGFRGFMYSPWNKFDFFIVTASVIDLLMDSLGADFIKFIKIGPQLARILRVLRVSRLLKMIKKFEGLQKIIETLIFSLPSLITVGSLLLLVFFIFAILGGFIFNGVIQGQVINEWNNFSNFGNSMLILFRCVTGENWYQIMFDLSKTPPDCIQGLNCGNSFSVVYFVTFILLCNFIMLNLFILILIEQFEQFNLKPNNIIEVFKENLKNFRQTWSGFSEFSKGIKVNQKNLVNFFYKLELPLGFEGNVSRKTVAKSIMEMNLLGDGKGNVYFNELLFASMYRVFAVPILQEIENPDIKKLMKNEELKIRQEIERLKRIQMNFETTERERFKKRMLTERIGQKMDLVNPMIMQLYLSMVFLSWKNYSIRSIEYFKRTLNVEEIDESEVNPAISEIKYRLRNGDQVFESSSSSESDSEYDSFYDSRRSSFQNESKVQYNPIEPDVIVKEENSESSHSSESENKVEEIPVKITNKRMSIMKLKSLEHLENVDYQSKEDFLRDVRDNPDEYEGEKPRRGSLIMELGNMLTNGVGKIRRSVRFNIGSRRGTQTIQSLQSFTNIETYESDKLPKASDATPGKENA